jgi:hypothetical protein
VLVWVIDRQAPGRSRGVQVLIGGNHRDTVQAHREPSSMKLTGNGQLYGIVGS